MTYNYDLDIASLILLGLVLLRFFRSKHINNEKTRIFRLFLISATITPILDIIGCEVIIRKAPAILTHGVNMLYYLAEQSNNFFFFLFVMAQLEIKRRMPIIRKAFVIAPVTFMTLVILTNPFHGILFTYDNNEFKSGPFRAVILWWPLFYYALALFYTKIKRKVLKRSERYLIYSIVVINCSARVLQYYNGSFLVYCYSLAISVLILYMFISNTDKSFDSETGLASRVVLEDDVNKLLLSGAYFKSVFVRIADYDLITTSYGTATAEEFINHVALLISQFSKKNVSYQVNNSTFVINLYYDDEADELIKKICDELDHSNEVNGIDIFCSYYITLVSCPDNCSDYETYIALLSYFQKMQELKYGVVNFDELKIQDKARENQVELAIERAIKDGSFEVFYQPICRSDTQKYITAEALVRLNDKELGMISPAEFIPLAESNGTIIVIGNIVLSKVCEFISTHNLEELGLEHLEVNLSAKQCLQRNFIETVDEITSKYNVTPDQLSFEITETASNHAPAIFTKNLALLRERGYRLALDDFGTGYANLQRLVSSDFDIVKFDKEMTQRTLADIKLHGLLEKLHNIFHSMEAKVVAEGVETVEQYELLKGIGCDYIQGYYFSRPLPTDDFVSFLEKHKESIK